MKDFIIDACNWYVDTKSNAALKKQTALRFKNRYRPLLEFLKVNQLLTDNNRDLNKINWLSFEIRVSHFTPEGLELVMLCHDKWLNDIDKGCNPANIRMWERNLHRLRETELTSMH